MYVSRSLRSVDAISKYFHININYFITFVSVLAISSAEPKKNGFEKKQTNICLTIVAAYGLQHDYTVDKLCAFICATRQMGTQ